MNRFLKVNEVKIVAPHYSSIDEAGDDLVRVLFRRVPFDPEDRLMRRRELNRFEGRLLVKTFDIVNVHAPFAVHYAGLRLAQVFGVPRVETYYRFFEEYFYDYIRFLPCQVVQAVTWQKRRNAIRCADPRLYWPNTCRCRTAAPWRAIGKTARMRRRVSSAKGGARVCDSA